MFPINYTLEIDQVFFFFFLALGEGSLGERAGQEEEEVFIDNSDL